MDTVLRLVADGTLILVLVVSAPIVMLWLRSDTWIKLPVLVMAGLTSLLIAKILSLVYQPAFARPFLELGVQPGAAYIDNPGFPSDHALLATVAIIAVYIATRNKRLLIILATLVILMSLGRVMALVHTPLDVIGGILAGISGSIWYRKLTN
ncbi:MAG: phosphatase PAP2 family protein [Candidatus Saccharimonadales bacterium]